MSDQPPPGAVQHPATWPTPEEIEAQTRELVQRFQEAICAADRSDAVVLEAALRLFTNSYGIKLAQIAPAGRGAVVRQLCVKVAARMLEVARLLTAPPGVTRH